MYFTVRYFGLSSNGQSQGILTVLVFGAGTDYALLMISRYREELRRHATAFAAIRAAIKGAAPAILASGTTVILALLCLLFSDLGSNKSLGPTAAIGIASAMLAMVTLLPAMLLLTGRRLFWPFAPRFESVEVARSGFWTHIGSLIGRRSRVSRNPLLGSGDPSEPLLLQSAYFRRQASGRRVPRPAAFGGRPPSSRRRFPGRPPLRFSGHCRSA